MKLCHVDDYENNPCLCVMEDEEFVDLESKMDSCIVLCKLLEEGKEYTECPYYYEEGDRSDYVDCLYEKHKDSLLDF